MVLWSLALLSLFVIEVEVTGRGEAKIAANLRASAEREALADAAIFEVAFHLQDSSGSYWDADGAPRILKIGNAQIAVRTEDLSNAVNLNTATPALLRALLVGIGVDEYRARQLTGAIESWPEESDSVAASAMMRGQPRVLYVGHTRPQMPFHDVSELAFVTGMTADILALLKPHVTVWSAYGPGPMSTDPVVRAAVADVRSEGGELPNDQNYDGAAIVAITATAISADGGRFTRYSVLRFDPNDLERPCRILAWDSAV
jgi:general secretion pathway protein K